MALLSWHRCCLRVLCSACPPVCVCALQLVNVQSNSEFASHLLNRDTWTDETVRTVVTGSFIFWQVHMGNKLVYPSATHARKFSRHGASAASSRPASLACPC